MLYKNLPLTPKGKPRERMSFRTIALSEFEEDWENSDWKTYFEETTLLTILWKEPNSKARNGHRQLLGVKKMSFDENDLDSFEVTYNRIKDTIDQKDPSLLPTPNSFPGQSLVIAPKGQKGDDAYNNLFKQDKTRIAFMLTKELLYDKIKN